MKLRGGRRAVPSPPPPVTKTRMTAFPRSCALAAACLALALATTAQTDRVIAAHSFCYTPIPADAPLHTNSAKFVAEFLRQKQAYYGTVSINTRAYAAPVYVVGSNLPTVAVSHWDRQQKGYRDKRLEAQWQAVPIPDYAEPADGTDAELVVWQPATDRMWEFWLTRKTNGVWQACWGGGMEHVSQNPGIWPDHYGTTATSLPFLGGQLSVAEVRRGEIRHALGIALVDLEHWNIISWPATRSDAWNPQHVPNRIPEGLRFRLDPSVDVDALQLHSVGKLIAKAAQKYGFVVWDKGGGITLRAENPKAYTLRGEQDPWPELFQGKPAWSILSGFPWDKLQFLPMDYGKPGGMTRGE